MYSSDAKGVLHAGLYYKPGSLKANWQMELVAWVFVEAQGFAKPAEKHSSQRAELDSQLDVLAQRGEPMALRWSSWSR